MGRRYLVGLGRGREQSLRGRSTARACSWIPLRQLECVIVRVVVSIPKPPIRSSTSDRAGRRPTPARIDGDGSGGSRGVRGRRGDVPVGAVRLRARRLHGGRHVVPGGAGGRRPLRAPRHGLPPRGAPLHLRPPLRRARRRQLQPHRLRRLLCRRTRQPLPLLRRAPLPGAGRRRCGRRPGDLGAHAGAVQAHARGPLAQGGSPHRRPCGRGAHLRHHLGRALGYRQGPPQRHPQDLAALSLHCLPHPRRSRVHRTVHEPS